MDNRVLIVTQLHDESFLSQGLQYTDFNHSHGGVSSYPQLHILKSTGPLGIGMECPACGGPITMDVGPNQPVTASIADALLAADENDQIDVTRHCWECGWTEDRAVSIDSIEITEGDSAAVGRAVLLDDIEDELAAIESLATLEDALAEVRRQRQLEPQTDDTNEDVPE